MRKIIVLAVSFLLAVTPVFADGGQILDDRWLCTNIDGNVTEETPAEMKDNYDLYVNKAWYIDTPIPEGKASVGAAYTVSDIVDEQLLALMKDKEQSGHDAEYYDGVSEAYNAILLQLIGGKELMKLHAELIDGCKDEEELN